MLLIIVMLLNFLVFFLIADEELGQLAREKLALDKENLVLKTKYDVVRGIIKEIIKLKKHGETEDKECQTLTEVCCKAFLLFCVILYI